MVAGTAAYGESLATPKPGIFTSDSINLVLTELGQRQRRVVLLEIFILESVSGSGDELAVARESTSCFDSFAYTLMKRGNIAAGYGRMFTLTESQTVVAWAEMRASQRVNVMSSPQIRVLDNMRANIDMGTNWQQIFNRDDYPLSFLHIAATPRINPDSSVILKLSLACGYGVETGRGIIDNTFTVDKGRTMLLDHIRDGNIELIILMTPSIIIENEFDTDTINQIREMIREHNDNQLPQDTGVSITVPANRLYNGNYASVLIMMSGPGFPVELYNQVKDKVIVDGNGEEENE